MKREPNKYEKKSRERIIQLIDTFCNGSQQEFANKVGIGKSSVSQYVNGTNFPSNLRAGQIADAFHVNPAWIMGFESPMYELKESESRPSGPEVKEFKGRLYVHLPVLGRVAGGTPIEQIDTGDYEDFEDFEIRPGEENDYFALRVAGQSMQPLIWDGSVVIVRKQPDAESGEIVVITIDGEDATCKRLKKYEDGIALLSENPSYKPMVYRASEISGLPIRILGKVVEVRTEIR